MISSESSRVARLPVPFLAAALPLPEAVTVTGPDLGEVDGRGAVFVLPVVSRADSPRAQVGIARRHLVALTGPAQRCLRARAEAARIQRLAWLRPALAMHLGRGDSG